MPHLELKQKKDVSNFRKISLGTWRTAYDPSIYGTMEFCMDQALQYLQEFRQATNKHLTVTHLIARVMAEILKQTPDVNALLRFNRIYLRKRIGIFIQVAIPDEDGDKIDLSGATVYDVADKSLLYLVDEVEQKVAAVRARKESALEKSRNLFQLVPYPLLNSTLNLLSFFSYTLNLDLSWLGMPQDPFGSVMITNIGSLGLDVAYAPLIPFSRVPILLATGAVKEVPVVEDGQIVIRKMMKVNATLDHRFVDGIHAAKMSKIMNAWLTEPYRYFGPIVGQPQNKQGLP